MSLPLHPILRIPVALPFLPGHELFAKNLIVAFYLHQTDDGRLFYECSMQGCTGCGCPSFERGYVVPTEVVEHLRLHVSLAHKGDYELYKLV